jgi:hypothetical protein
VHPPMIDEIEEKQSKIGLRNFDNPAFGGF